MSGLFALQLGREGSGLCCASPEPSGMTVFVWGAIEDKEIL
jgi:hypothetical protein